MKKSPSNAVLVRALQSSLIIILSVIFSVTYTDLFGNNLFPSCWAEVLCDLLATLMLFIAYLIA